MLHILQLEGAVTLDLFVGTWTLRMVLSRDVANFHLLSHIWSVYQRTANYSMHKGV